MTEDGDMQIALINRSHDKKQKVNINVPNGYIPVTMWKIDNSDISKANFENERDNISLQTINLSKKHLNSTFTMSPSGFIMVKYERIK